MTPEQQEAILKLYFRKQTQLKQLLVEAVSTREIDEVKIDIRFLEPIVQEMFTV